MPATTDEWPPDILFDAVYADRVPRRFPPKTVSYQKIIDQRAADTERRKEQSEERANRESRADKDRGDYFDYLMMKPYIMIPPDELEAFWREAAQKTGKS
jgi:hypothetical protein